MSVISLASTVTGGAVGTGVTKFTAQHADAPARQHATWRAAMRYVVGSTALTSIALVVWRAPLAQALLGDRGLGVVFVALACALPVASAGNVVLAIINGKKDVGIYVTQSILASVIGCGLTAGLAMAFGTLGALVALALSLMSAAVATFGLSLRAPWLKLNSFYGRIPVGTMSSLLSYALMTLTGSGRRSAEPTAGTRTSHRPIRLDTDRKLAGCIQGQRNLPDVLYRDVDQLLPP